MSGTVGMEMNSVFTGTLVGKIDGATALLVTSPKLRKTDSTSFPLRAADSARIHFVGSLSSCVIEIVCVSAPCRS